MNSGNTKPHPNIKPQIELVTSPTCQLCQAARETVQSLTAEFALTFTELSIADDVELATRFGEEIPVLLINGIQRDFWKIDPVRLRRLLEREIAAL